MISGVHSSSIIDGLAALTRVNVARSPRSSPTIRNTQEPTTVRRIDRVEISDEARVAAQPAADCDCDDLSDEEKAVVRDLQSRDREVRAHEQAQKAAGGQHTGSISYSYESGPDGRRYAVGGEVPIDASPTDDPDETIRKMQQVRRAALAPAEPSGADRAVAAKAQQAERAARAEKREVAADERAAAAEPADTGAADTAGSPSASSDRTSTAAAGRGYVTPPSAVDSHRIDLVA